MRLGEVYLYRLMFADGFAEGQGHTDRHLRSSRPMASGDPTKKPRAIQKHP